MKRPKRPVEYWRYFDMRVIVYLATGFEEVEALIPVDMMRRAGMDVVLSSIDEEKMVESSHSVKVEADMTLSESDREDFDIVFLPGGMPGAVNLSQCWSVNERIIRMAGNGKIVSAICASPSVVLANAGLLNGRKATCYPGCEGYSEKKDFLPDGVVVDENIIKRKSAGFAFDLSLKIIEKAISKEKADEVASAVYFSR